MHNASMQAARGRKHLRREGDRELHEGDRVEECTGGMEAGNREVDRVWRQVREASREAGREAGNQKEAGEGLI